MPGTNILKLLQSLTGAGFLGLDTLTIPELKGGKSNLLYNRVRKRTTGSHVIAFTNKNSNGYENMVHRRLDAEGKDPGHFVLSPRKWGVRLPGLPIVTHKGRYYLEVIFIQGGVSEYLLDGNVVDKSEIIGLKEGGRPAQGGLEDTVVLRDYALDSLTRVRYDQIEAIGPFYYSK